jgi:hypothetical protein
MYIFLQNLPTMNILDPIFYRTLFYDFSPVISPRSQHIHHLVVTYQVQNILHVHENRCMYVFVKRKGILYVCVCEEKRNLVCMFIQEVKVFCRVY